MATIQTGIYSCLSEVQGNPANTPAAADFHVAPAPTSAQAKDHIKTINAITNLATATVADRIAVANLTTTNAAFSKELDAITAKLVTAMTKVASVTQQLSDFRVGNKGVGSGHSSLNKNYCRSCGYRSKHLSWYCTVPNPEHQKMAKASNIMGGLQTNKSS